MRTISIILFAFVLSIPVFAQSTTKKCGQMKKYLRENVQKLEKTGHYLLLKEEDLKASSTEAPWTEFELKFIKMANSCFIGLTPEQVNKILGGGEFYQNNSPRPYGALQGDKRYIYTYNALYDGVYYRYSVRIQLYANVKKITKIGGGGGSSTPNQRSIIIK